MDKRDVAISIGVSCLSHLTGLTKNIKFAANATSRAMDLANGGVKAHGGFHRLYGGHSPSVWFVNPIEMAKDSLTPNGLPNLGIETAVRKVGLKPSVAQKWGTTNVGHFASAVVGGVDSIFNARDFLSRPDKFESNMLGTTAKGVVKVGVGLAHGNVPLVVFGFSDLGLVAYRKIENSVEINFESSYCFS